MTVVASLKGLEYPKDLDDDEDVFGSADVVDIDPDGVINVAVLGTGNYGSSFAERLTRSGDGVRVVLASRRGSADPNGFTPPCRVVSYDKAVMGADIVVLAVPVDAHQAVVQSLGTLLDDKIVIDVSNAKPQSMLEKLTSCCGGRTDAEGSNAHRLIDLLWENGVTNATVVKAFNNISAYTLSLQPGHPSAGCKACMISGESGDAKRQVAVLARRMGFDNMDLGGIDAATSQERVVFRFFDGWRVAAAIALVSGVLFLFADVLQHYVYGPEDWAACPKRMTLIVTGDISALMLVLSFLPGPIAAIWQLVRGTARRPFPAWFGNWLLIRKQLGLLAFFICIPHVILACMGGAETPPQLVNQLAPVFGTLSFALLYLVASCSNSSVSGQFTWAEFRFVFVRVGYTAVALALGHMICLAVIAMRDIGQLPVTIMLSAVLCGTVLVLKLVTSMPPIGTMVEQIRSQQTVSVLPKFTLSPRAVFSPSVKDSSQKFESP